QRSIAVSFSLLTRDGSAPHVGRSAKPGTGVLLGGLEGLRVAKKTLARCSLLTRRSDGPPNGPDAPFIIPLMQAKPGRPNRVRSRTSALPRFTFLMRIRAGPPAPGSRTERGRRTAASRSCFTRKMAGATGPFCGKKRARECPTPSILGIHRRGGCCAPAARLRLALTLTGTNCGGRPTAGRRGSSRSTPSAFTLSRPAKIAESPKRPQILRANIRLDLAIDTTSVTKFLVASRKAKYRLG